jgi:hypothetical protein
MQHIVPAFGEFTRELDRKGMARIIVEQNSHSRNVLPPQAARRLKTPQPIWKIWPIQSSGAIAANPCCATR